MKKNYYLLLALALPSVAAVAEPMSFNVIGETANITVKIGEQSLPFLARIDTGASITSVHATDIEVEDGFEEMEANIGKSISFTTTNENKDEIRLHGSITDVTAIRNAHGAEYRYSVNLELTFEEDTRNVDVTLRDRAKMRHKLLVGRNWLKGHYLVDVAVDDESLRDKHPNPKIVEL